MIFMFHVRITRSFYNRILFFKIRYCVPIIVYFCIYDIKYIIIYIVSMYIILLYIEYIYLQNLYFKS